MGLFNARTRPQMVKNLADDRRAREQGRRRGRAAEVLADDRVHRHGVDQQGAVARTATSELAYRLLHNNQYPSWLYAIDQGATSIWERLNGYTVENGFGGNNSMNSFNHYSFGAVGQWMMAHSLGIERDEPGLPEVHPAARARSDRASMTSAEGYYDSMYGRISSAWKVDGNDAHLPRDGSGEHDGHALPAHRVGGVGEGRRERRPQRERRHLRQVRERQGGLHAEVGPLHVHREPLRKRHRHSRSRFT